MSHPLNGTYGFKDSYLTIRVDGESGYELHGLSLTGRFGWSGEYTKRLDGILYRWPVAHGVVSDVGGGAFQLAFLLLAPPSTGGALERAGYTGFVDAFAGLGIGDPTTGCVEALQIRFISTTYDGQAEGWDRFKWVPSLQALETRNYVRTVIDP